LIRDRAKIPQPVQLTVPAGKEHRRKREQLRRSRHTEKRKKRESKQSKQAVTQEGQAREGG